MSTDTCRTRLTLQRGQSTRLSGRWAARLASAEGTLWITLDHDPRDIVLGPGQSVELGTGAPVLVSSLGGPAVMDVAPARQAAEVH